MTEKTSIIESLKAHMTNDEKLLYDGAWYYLRTCITIDKKCSYCGVQFGPRLGGMHDSNCIVTHARETIARLREKRLHTEGRL